MNSISTCCTFITCINVKRVLKYSCKSLGPRDKILTSRNKAEILPCKQHVGERVVEFVACFASYVFRFLIQMRQNSGQL